MDYFYGDHEYRVKSYDEIKEVADNYDKSGKLPRDDDKNDYPPLQPFYRGQADKDWKITASINRAKSLKKEITRVTEKDLEVNRSVFDVVSHIQHYQTGTRFIDFTTDIDIAAFFACSDLLDKDAAVYIWSYQPHEPEWYTVYVICELELLWKEKIVSVRDLSNRLWNKYPIFSKQFDNIESLDGAIISFLPSGMMVIPDEEALTGNQRLERQKGAFFLCPPKFLKDITAYDRFHSIAGRNIFVPDTARDIFKVWSDNTLTKIVIPKEIKKLILYELAEKGITKEYLLP